MVVLDIVASFATFAVDLIVALLKTYNQWASRLTKYVISGWQLFKCNNKSTNSSKAKIWSGIQIQISELIRIWLSAGLLPNILDSFSCRHESFTKCC